MIAAFIVLFLVILGLIALIYFLLKHFQQVTCSLLEQNKDLTDKVYFLRSQDFITNRVLDSTPEPQPEPQPEEVGIPLDQAPYEDVMDSFRR